MHKMYPITLKYPSNVICWNTRYIISKRPKKAIRAIRA